MGAETGLSDGAAARAVFTSKYENIIAMIAIIGRIGLTMGFSGGLLRGVGSGFPPLPLVEPQLEGIHKIGAAVIDDAVGGIGPTDDADGQVIAGGGEEVGQAATFGPEQHAGLGGIVEPLVEIAVAGIVGDQGRIRRRGDKPSSVKDHFRDR